MPILISYALLLVYVVPSAAKSAVEQKFVPEHRAAEAEETAGGVKLQLMKTEGDVAITNNRGKNVLFLEKMQLYSGYHVETQEASYAWINLDSTKLTKLDAVSEMEVRKSSDGENLEILLNSGKLFFNVTEPLTDDETLKVRTSTMTVGIRGTSGWVEVTDCGDTRVYLLEGTVECGVTDPVTGQTKEADLSGGDTADFLVYPQEREGDKCDIIRYGFTEDEINGFVLAEAVQDEGLCREIYDASGLDLMACAAEAQQRLEADQEEMHRKLLDIEKRLAEQDHNVSVDPVWGTEMAAAVGTNSVSQKMLATTEAGIDGGHTETAAASDGVEKAEKPEQPGHVDNGNHAGSPGNSSGSNSAGDSDDPESGGNSGGSENASNFGNTDVVWSMDGPDGFEGIPGVTDSAENTGNAENTNNSGNSGSTGGTEPEEPVGEKVLTLKASEATVQLIEEGWKNYDKVIIAPDDGSTTINLKLEGNLTVPEGKILEVDGILSSPRRLTNNGKIIAEKIDNITWDCNLVNSGEIVGAIYASSGLIHIVGGKIDAVYIDSKPLSMQNSGHVQIEGGTINYIEMDDQVSLRMEQGNVTTIVNRGESSVSILGGTVGTLYSENDNYVVADNTVGEIKGIEELPDTASALSDLVPLRIDDMAEESFIADKTEESDAEESSEDKEDFDEEENSDEKEAEVGKVPDPASDFDSAPNSDATQDTDPSEDPDENQSPEPDTPEPPAAGEDSVGEKDAGENGTASADKVEDSDSANNPMQQPTEDLIPSAGKDQSSEGETPVLPEQLPLGTIPTLPEQLPVANMVEEYMQVNRDEEWYE